MALELLKRRDDRWFKSDKLLPGWRVSWRFGVLKNGAYAVQDLHIDQLNSQSVADVDAWIAGLYTPGQGITTRLLRQLRLGEPSARTKRILTKARRQMKVKAAAGKKEQRGRPRRDDAWYKTLAARYKASPTKKSLAAEYGVGAATMRAAIYRCRQYGFLGPTPKGIARA